MCRLLWAFSFLALILFAGRPMTAAESKPARKSTPVRDAGAVPAGRPAAGAATETAVFAGGCFWCTEFAFEQIAGVVDVESGYCGGTRASANYQQVHRGFTGHAEAIRVTYDPKKVTYEQLLGVFFDAHDPTQYNRQKEDVGRQYRSAIFFADDDQKKQAEAKIADLESKRVFKKKIVTRLEPLVEFFPAEDYHQDYARRNPFLPYIQSHAVSGAVNVRNRHPNLVRTADE